MKNIYLTITAFLLSFLAISCQDEAGALKFNGFAIHADQQEYHADKGTFITLQGEVICEFGIKEYAVTTQDWSENAQGETTTVAIAGSPKKYNLQHILTLPDFVDCTQNEVMITFTDYAGHTVSQLFTVHVQEDKTNPELVITSPTHESVLAPREILLFNLSATDNLKMKSLTIACEQIGYSKTYTPEANNSREISVYDIFSLQGMSGLYTFVITAIDLQGNATTESVDIIVMISSKPAIIRSEAATSCGVAGGSLNLIYDFETSYNRTLTAVRITSELLGIDKTYSPNVAEYSLSDVFAIDGSLGYRRNVPVLITATNDIGEETSFQDYCDIVQDLFIIGDGTLAKRKDEKALKMERSATDPNVFEAVTWIEKVGQGVKFLSNNNFNELNLGLDAAGKIVNASTSQYIVTPTTGYYLYRFNAMTWEYSLELYTPSTSPKHSEMYVFGYEFLYWENNQWNAQQHWNTLFAMQTYPENPHRFYIDVKTGPGQLVPDGDWHRRAIFKFAAQNHLNSGGTFYGMRQESGDQWSWWEHVGPLYSFTNASEAPNFVEDGRSNAVMRIVVDTYLNKIIAVR